MSRKMHRRQFVQSSVAILSAGVWSTNAIGRAANRSANEKLNLALIGVGGQGDLNLQGCQSQNIVALCDVDDQRAGKAYETYPRVKKFYDFRRMFDEIESEIDAVVVSTPDHTHFNPSIWAAERGKHLYVEKPLCHSVWETRTLTNLVREKGLASQLGAQRHAQRPLRDAVELIRGGVLGEINAVYSWIDSDRGMPAIPAGSPAVPPHLQWDLWLGPAADRSYQPEYVPYNWRFWWDFGTGDTGNWGCHILDIPFWSLDLKYPTSIELGPGGEWHEQTTPKSLTTKFTFPASDKRGPVELHWLQGKPAILDELRLDADDMNNLFIGAEGMLLCGFGSWRLLPEEKFVGVTPPRTIADSPGFHQEWFDACRGGPPASCHFDYGGPLTETALLGNVAFRAKGGFQWDAATMSPHGNLSAQQFLRSHFRESWDIA